MLVIIYLNPCPPQNIKHVKGSAISRTLQLSSPSDLLRLRWPLAISVQRPRSWRLIPGTHWNIYIHSHRLWAQIMDAKSNALRCAINRMTTQRPWHSPILCMIGLAAHLCVLHVINYKYPWFACLTSAWSGLGIFTVYDRNGKQSSAIQCPTTRLGMPVTPRTR